MAEVQLRCNIQTCRKILDEKAFVTSCSHIFCVDHGQGSAKNESCLACGTKLKNKFDIRITDLQPSDQCKSLNRECEIKENAIRQGRAENENLRMNCSTVTASYKAELENTKRMAQSIKNELEEKIKEIERQKEQLVHSSRLNKKLQMKLESCRRQIVHMKSCDASPKPVPSFTPSRFNFDLERKSDTPFGAAGERLNGGDFSWPYARYST